jgi:biopolymer transport protein ExbD
MGKVKIKRKSTLIDMTAMSDVTVLLLTFFMLTSTFLQKEPTIVFTPSSVSEEKVPVKDLVTILVSSENKNAKEGEDPTLSEGKIFISFAGDSVLPSEALRTAILEKAVAFYNEEHPKNAIQLNQAQMNAFAKTNMLGVPFKYLPEVLSKSATELDKFQSDLTDPRVGIPIDGNKDKNGRLNDFQIWMKALSNVAQDGRRDKIMELGIDETTDEGRAKLKDIDMLYNILYQGKAISVKADKDTPFTTINEVFDNLQTMGLNKFTLMTALKSEDATN